MSFRIESNTYQGTGGRTIRETRFHDYSERETRDLQDGTRICCDILFSKPQGSGEKKCRVITWTVLGAGVGGAAGSGFGGIGAVPGAIIGGMIGMGIGTCSIL
jgi:hypothetical protein